MNRLVGISSQGLFASSRGKVTLSRLVLGEFTSYIIELRSSFQLLESFFFLCVLLTEDVANVDAEG